MYAGLTLEQLAKTITDQQDAKADYVANTKAARVEVDGDKPVMVLGNKQFDINRHTHGQIAQFIPKMRRDYYDEMASNLPELLATNVNAWFDKLATPRMFRTMGGNNRAFLSDRYRSLDNLDLAEAALPVLADLGVEIIAADITETRMYIKAVDKRIQRDIPQGHKMGDGTHTIFRTNSPGIVISNSEVGSGSLSVETSIWDHVCTNLAIFGQRAMKKYHTGSRTGGALGDDVFHLLADDTRKATDKAVWMQVRDIVRGAFDEAKFDADIKTITDMTEQPIDGDPMAVVEVTAKKFRLTEGEKGSVLRHLIEGGDLSRFGLYNAITRTGEDASDMDRATEFERLGGRMIELPATEWRELAQAA